MNWLIWIGLPAVLAGGALFFYTRPPGWWAGFIIELGKKIVLPNFGKLLKPAPPLTEEQRERIKDGEPESRVRQFPDKPKSTIKNLKPSKETPRK